MDEQTLNLLRKLKILLVEDDAFLGATLLEALKPYAGKAVLETDGKAALERFFADDFNVVVTDINLPKISGLSLARQIKEVGKNVPIIFITAFDSGHNVEAAIDIGAEAFLHKPFSLERLYGALLMALGKVDGGQMSLGRGYFYDAEAKELFKGEAVVHLTKTEAALLEILVANAGSVVSFESLERNVWRYKQATPDAMRMYVNKLRSKTYHELIVNIQGYGYKLEIPSCEDR